MRCIIYVFSGTGNTMLVAEEYAASLGPETQIAVIDSSFRSLPSSDGYQLVGIGYPVHAFNTPEIVERFARELKPSVHQNLFIFHTGGEGLHFNDTSSVRLRRIFRKDFTILSERHYAMPYNMIFRHSDAMVKHMVTYMRKLVSLHVSSLLAERVESTKFMPLCRIVSSVLRIEWLYAKLQGPAMRAGKDCTGCGLCARRCPMGNITMENGRPEFGRNCSLCVRCSFSCPEDAISLGLLNGWRVNGPYEFDRIMADRTIPDTMPIEKLPRLYRKYYREADAMLRKES